MRAVSSLSHLSPGGGGGDFKREAVGAIVAAMTGAAFRNKVLVVLSGYVRRGPAYCLSAVPVTCNKVSCTGASTHTRFLPLRPL